MKVIFITGNKNKFEEARRIIPDLEQSNIDLTEIQGIDAEEIIVHKLNEGRKFIKGNFIVEDTSLYLNCMNGLPGPLIKWFLKTVGLEGLVKIAESFGNNKAEAKIIVGLAMEDGLNKYFEGTAEGIIVKPRGKIDFGWNSIFQQEGQDKTYAEMTLEEKNKISMRKIAFQKLADFILNP